MRKKYFFSWIVVFLLCLPVVGRAQVNIDEEHFPDPVFREYVSENIDTDKSGALNEEECAAVFKIDVSGMVFPGSFADLTGIEHFPLLETLDCSNIGITSLDLSGNPALETLACSSTGITSLDLRGNPALKFLFCSNTGITSLDVSQNPALETLDCSNTGITSLDVSQNPALETLDCSNTGITSLDVSGNPVLKFLLCSNTGITSLDLKENSALETLSCSNTSITSLGVNGNPALRDLSCPNISITSLDLSGNPALESLNCSNTGLTSLDLSGNPALLNLDCSNTGLTSLDVSGNPALKTLSCSDIDITSLDLSGNPALWDLYCPNTGITSLDLSHNPEMIGVFCDNSRCEVAAEEGGIYDLSRLPGFDVSRAGEWNGGSVEGTILTFQDTAVTYSYTTLYSGLSSIPAALTFRLVANPALIAKPVEFSPASGSIVKKGDTIRLSCATEGASIYYGLGEGSEPDQEYKPAEGIIITADTTYITALAMIPGHDTSEVVSAVYYVKVEEPDPDPDPDPDTIQVVLPSGLEAGVEGDTVTLSWKSEEDYIYEVKVEGPGEQDSLTWEVSSAGERTECRFTGLEKGTYRWWVRVIGVGETDTISAYVEGEEFKIGEVSSRKEELAGLRIYPNPTSGNFMVEVKESVRLDIYTATGLRVKSLELGAGTESLELKVSGLYLMRFTAADGRSEYRRLVVR